MYVRVGNQWSRGVVIARVRSFCSEPSSSMLRSPPIELPLPLGRSGLNSHQVVLDFRLPVRYYHMSFSFVTIILPSSTENAKKITLSTVLEPLESQFLFLVALLSSCSSWSSLVAGLDSCL
jgi:hypothetical protein